MSKDLTSPDTSDLQTLARDIRDAHEQVKIGVEHSLTHVKLCGELFLKAKNAVPHGDWGDWVDQNCEMSLRSAQAYMRIARNWDKIEVAKAQSVAHLDGIVSCLALLNEPEAASEKQPDVKSSPVESAEPSQPDIPRGGTASEKQPEFLGTPLETVSQKPDVKSEPPIPKHLQRIFEGLPKWKEAHAHYGKLRSLLLEISRLHPENGIRVMDMQPIDTLLTELYGLMTTVEPTKICPTCKGKNCEACGSRGYLIKGRVPHRPITFPNMLETTN